MKQAQKKCIAAAVGLMLTAPVFGTLPSAPVSAATLLSAAFETTNDSFSGRGGAKAAWTSDQSYEENCSLFVSGRTSAWHGAQRDASSFLVAGETYEFSAAVYQESGTDAEMKFSLQYTGTDGKAVYDQIALKTAKSGEWLVLSNPAYTVPEGASDPVIYLETTESLTDFYVDSVTVKGAPPTIKKGDADGNLSVNTNDVLHLARFLSCQTDEIEQGADYNGDGRINAADLTLLKHALLNPVITPIQGDWDNYQEQATGNDLKALQGSLRQVGNTARIREKIAKAQRGENVTIGYIGGSITGGGSATSEANRYVNLSYEYFKQTFGQGNHVSFVNAGVAGTSSVVGNMRVEKDIFSHNCDIIFIEFAVNDQGGDRFQKSYESLVKKCLMQENAPAVVLITLCQKSMGSNEDWMIKVGQNYDLPVISGKGAIQAGNLDWDSKYGSGDTIHPGNGGHKLIADCIGYYYRQALRSENASDSYEIPNKTVFGDEYATAHMVSFEQLDGFNAGSWTLKNGAYVKSGGSPMKFSVNGKGILLLFQSNSQGMGAVNVTANGQTKKVSANLQYTWGGQDGDVGYYQPQAGKINIEISDGGSGNFVLYGIAVIE